MVSIDGEGGGLQEIYLWCLHEARAPPDVSTGFYFKRTWEKDVSVGHNMAHTYLNRKGNIICK